MYSDYVFLKEIKGVHELIGVKIDCKTLLQNTISKSEKCENKKVVGQKMGAKLESVLFYTTNLQKFLANNFFWVNFRKI